MTNEQIAELCARLTGNDYTCPENMGCGTMKFCACDTMEEAVARIAALNVEVARKDEALAQAATQISDLARQLGEAQGKLEASELPGIVDGWRAKCETLEAEVARLTKRLAVRAQLEKEG